MKYFKEEYRRHVITYECEAMECKALAKISGEPGKVHAIDQSKCIKCRSCMQKCPFKAIGAGQTTQVDMSNFQC